MSEEEIAVLIEVLEKRREELRGGATRQVADAVAQTGVAVIGSAPAVALAETGLSTGLALSLSAHNATGAQAAGTTQLHASTVLAVNRLLGGVRRPKLTSLLADLAAMEEA